MYLVTASSDLNNMKFVVTKVKVRVTRDLSRDG